MLAALDLINAAALSPTSWKSAACDGEHPRLRIAPALPAM
jgi:hypothetical protein